MTKIQASDRRMLFIWFYQPAFCRVCVFILWTSCLLTNK